VEKITRAGEPVATTLVPPGSPGYAPPAGLPYDVARARKLLADAGYPDGKNFPDVSLLYASRGSTGNIATEIQALWRRDLGITSIHLRGQEWKVYLNTQSEIDFDLDLAAWIGDYNDPKTFLDMFVTNGGNNNTGWSNADYDKLLDSSESITDPKARMQVLEKMEKILVEDQLPILPLYYYVGMSLYYPNRLGGYEPNFVDDHRWGNFYIPEKHQTASLLP
jgi:oligopeptide transport system substrate-binding protein